MTRTFQVSAIRVVFVVSQSGSLCSLCFGWTELRWLRELRKVWWWGWWWERPSLSSCCSSLNKNKNSLYWKISVFPHPALQPGCCRRSSCSSRRSRWSSPSSPSRGSRTPRGTACPSSSSRGLSPSHLEISSLVRRGFAPLGRVRLSVCDWASNFYQFHLKLRKTPPPPTETHAWSNE